MRDAVRCRDHLDHQVHVPEDHLDHRDPDHLDHQNRDLHLDHQGVDPYRDDQLLGHQGDLHPDSSDAKDHRCRPDHDQVHSVECDRCVHPCQRDVGHRDRDPSADGDPHRVGGNRLVVAESDDHFPVVAESDDHLARDVVADHPAVVAVQQLEESDVVLALAPTVRTEQMVRCGRNHP